MFMLEAFLNVKFASAVEHHRRERSSIFQSGVVVVGGVVSVIVHSQQNVLSVLNLGQAC